MTGLTRKSRRRKAELLAAAAACFRDRGVLNTSLADVAARAGVSPGHLAYYFKTRDVLIARVFEWCWMDVRELFEALVDRPDPLEALIDEDFAVLHRKRDHCKLTERNMLELYAEATRNGLLLDMFCGYFREAYERLLEILLQAEAEDRFRHGVHVHGMANMLATFFAAHPVTWVADVHYTRDLYRHALQAVIRPAMKDPYAIGPWRHAPPILSRSEAGGDVLPLPA